MRKGFSLIELMTVVAAVAILASISYSMYTRKVAASRAKGASNCLGAVSVAMENYFANYGQYPAPGNFAALGFDDDVCDGENMYTFSWTLGPQNQYYRIRVIDSIRSVWKDYAYGNDVWVQCGHRGGPLNIQSPDNINVPDGDQLCW